MAMTDSSLEVVRRLIERFGAGDVEAALELLPEDIVIVIPPTISAEPDTYEGHAGVRRYFAGFEGQIDDVRFEMLDAFAHEDRVLVPMRMAGRGTSSGIEVTQDVVTVYHVRHGQVVRIEAQPDLESAREC